MTTNQKLMTNWRWWICSLLFVATTVNYLDRQVLSLTYEEFIKPEFHWTDADYGLITSFFSIFYAVCCLFAGKFVDWMGTKRGYLIAIGVWSAGACLHALCGWATASISGLGSVEAMRAVEVGSSAALAVSTTSVFPQEGPCVCHIYLQRRGLCGRPCRATADTAAGCEVWLGDGLHHHRRLGFHLDVLLGIHVRQTGEEQEGQCG